MESINAFAKGVIRFVAPGPEVAITTPSSPVDCAYPSAMWPAPCSCLARICRIGLSYNGSYAGKIAPPGTPKTVDTLRYSNPLITNSAPVSCSLLIKTKLLHRY